MSKATNDLRQACDAVASAERRMANRIAAASVLLRLIEVALVEMDTSRSHRCADRINKLLPFIDGTEDLYDHRLLETQP